MKEAFEALNRINLDEGKIHSSIICVICGRPMTGTQKLLWIKKEDMIKHEDKLSVQKYEDQFNFKITSTLRSQYLLDDETFCNILLSRKSRKNEEDDSYSCCEQCHRSM